jgi:hypothetical protein
MALKWVVEAVATSVPESVRLMEDCLDAYDIYPFNRVISEGVKDKRGQSRPNGHW